MSQSLEAVVTGILASLLATMAWFVATRRVRPKIEIAPVIAEQVPSASAQDEIRCQIKIVNRSRRMATDLILELVLLRPSRVKGGEVKVRRSVPLLGPPPLFLPGRARGDAESNNAYRIGTNHDLRAWLAAYPDASLRLRLAARDSVTGVGRVFEQWYFDPASEILRGSYAKGQTFEIVPSGIGEGPLRA